MLKFVMDPHDDGPGGRSVFRLVATGAGGAYEPHLRRLLHDLLLRQETAE
ncbi:hypothetical protein [Catenuloplanes indicus]|uniref:Uncharacterized protein n=1 Tax=Catenuloplanes indicus TaxID=137267 RepID=A0AAE4AXC2_9ACTN|nr:hypothetical protein [Catenuloplanes indicus]MDQ0366855.1 hypothetical protein [Catenuloplanes indicus]